MIRTASVVDLDRAITWYQDTLGFTMINRGSRQNGAFQFADLEVPGFKTFLLHDSEGHEIEIVTAS